MKQLALSGFLICLLAACQSASAPKTLYQWEDYQAHVYRYFKNSGREEQIGEMEKGLEKIRADNGRAPPGYYAHLGLLYLDSGKDDSALQAFQSEKALFPESAPYMDFLLKNAAAKKPSATRVPVSSGKRAE
jgi:hypothetical protein